MEFEVISSPDTSPAFGPYSQATRAGGFVFVSGQAAIDPKTGKLIEGGIREQTTLILKNISAILDAAGSDLGHVVKVTIYLSDWKYFKEMNEVYATFFPGKAPARATAQGARYPEGSLLAMEAIALVK